MNVQRRRPKAANGPVQDKASAVCRGEASRGFRYAVLVNDDAVIDAAVSNAEGTLVGAPVGYGQKFNLFSFNGTGQSSNKTRAPKIADRTKKAPLTIKGKNILEHPVFRANQRQTSASTGHDTASFSLIQLKPTASERNLVSMKGLEDPGEAFALPEIPPSNPPNIVMDPKGKEDSTGPCPNATELVAPATREAQDALTGSPVVV
ncbi:hypothetical protein K2173_012770 [Erythroxylum novogranatense]|uniref:Uncharacterized protein n=1 Tax=Erythroxylum novogranatense TaxID=1862640 RepID=A0AAV8UCP1_9ROSI|nr:hypothetical protein K2173_012770 [Erythroxylum novogranatense]